MMEMEMELTKVQQQETHAPHQFGEVLEFLLNSFRAKLTICSGKKGQGRSRSRPDSAVVEECPFNFSQFLAKGKALVASQEMKLRMLQDLKILQREGIFDSIMPFLIPFTRSTSLGRLRPQLKQSEPSAVPSIDVSLVKSAKHQKHDGSLRRGLTPAPPPEPQIDYPIVIHISDEVKGVHQDFHCQQSVLVQEMGYFALIISKGQKLHDMDITIHCDVTIFEWMMKWICHHTKQNVDPPELDAINVVGLTVSADFLKMPVLKSTCFNFLKDNIELVIANSSNLGCLNDSLLTEFANELNIRELEDVIVPADRMDRITSKLYTQFIFALNSPSPNAKMGHFSSTATLFHCKLCDQLIINEVATKVVCTNVKFDWQGKLYSCHEKNENWALGSHVIGLKRELKSWRKVYWRLWGTVHFFQCSTCRVRFSGMQFKQCRYHPENPKFLVEVVKPPQAETNNEKSVDKSQASNVRESALRAQRGAAPPEPPEKKYVYKPYGKFTCCKALTYKYLTSPNLSGCQLQEHTLGTESTASQILHTYRDLIVCDGEQLEPSYRPGASAHNLIQLSIGRSLFASPLTPLSCLPAVAAGYDNKNAEMGAGSFRLTRQSRLGPQESTESDEDCSSNDSEDDDNPCQFPYIGPTHGNSRVHNEPETWTWNNDLNTRYNQDMQRESEEKLMLDLTLFLAQRVPIDSNFDVALSQFTQSRISKSNRYSLFGQENSGSFVKLEQMWLDENGKGRQHLRSGTSNVL